MKFENEERWRNWRKNKLADDASAANLQKTWNDLKRKTNKLIAVWEMCEMLKAGKFQVSS